ncbi:FmdB family zinc ribbon protein [Streptomyces sp. WI04-05B]|uniref:FmdB family zinc ribbon protein n=1 Tax=Streptomyces TaxID=1883 RepID=UPI0029AD07EA|nr:MULTISPECIES: FmdB family zinc ribbon protein [unclassified Streptomyces]MDX2546781.1 zinc ribbon domain-containing protein [Streptomyces sp. WI04-05B]MDX2589577.1 zinc ribbon domain-containing protein [Streptomyces sp. WI04-05A]MDX3750629.1 zinc ribbon domain-containing protein [Streptomyces sp. AK08-02]
MPTYQYQCTACGEGLEAVQKFTDDALTECPACNGRLKKVFSAVGIVFKGSGFYRNDSRGSSSSSAPASKPSTASSSTSSSSDSSSSSSSSSSSGSSSSSSSSSGSSSSSSTSSAA